MNTTSEIEILKAMADGVRLRLLSLLSLGQLCICDLTETLQLPQSTVSRHMSRLLRCGLVEVEQRARWRYYRLAEQPIMGWSDLKQFVHDLARNDPYRADRLKLRHILSAKTTAHNRNCPEPTLKEDK